SECILQQVADRGREHLAVAVDRETQAGGENDQTAAVGARLEGRGYLYLLDELGKRDQLAPPRDPGPDAHVGERAVDEIAQPDQGAVERRAGGPGEPDVARLDGVERDRRGLDQDAQLMRERPQALVQRLRIALADMHFALLGERGNGVSDGVVEAAVEGSELVDLERHGALERE